MESSELAVIGVTCDLVGVFFLANSIIFRRPRKVIEEFFGVGAGSMTAVRDYTLNKIQVVIGFLFLSSGFLMLGVANIDAIKDRVATVIICVAIVGCAGLVYLIGATYSRRSFRRYLQEFFQKHKWDFTKNMALTKEIGLFLGIRQTRETTVEDYVRKVREALGLPAEPERTPNAPSVSGGDRGRKLRADITALPGR